VGLFVQIWDLLSVALIRKEAQRVCIAHLTQFITARLNDTPNTVQLHVPMYSTAYFQAKIITQKKHVLSESLLSQVSAHINILK